METNQYCRQESGTPTIISSICSTVSSSRNGPQCLGGPPRIQPNEGACARCNAWDASDEGRQGEFAEVNRVGLRGAGRGLEGARRGAERTVPVTAPGRGRRQLLLIR